MAAGRPDSGAFLPLGPLANPPLDWSQLCLAAFVAVAAPFVGPTLSLSPPGLLVGFAAAILSFPSEALHSSFAIVRQNSLGASYALLFVSVLFSILCFFFLHAKI